MLGITFASETFERLLFKTQTNSYSTKCVVPTVLVTQMSQWSKKNRIIIISNGVQQRQNRKKPKRYLFSDDQIQSQSSQQVSRNPKKKHLIKKQRKQDPDYSVKRQKNDRNVISNIIHHLMKHISTCISNAEFKNLFEKQKINLRVQQFIMLMQQKDKECKTYITNKHLKLLWNDSNQPQFSKAMRILSRIFLEKYSFLTIFNGNKLNKQSKSLHYKGRRQLLQFLAKLK